MRAFVNNCEFKDAQYRGLQTESMVEQYFQSKQQAEALEDEGSGQPQRSRQPDMADLNLFIYIVIRDEKLLQLRDKIEAASHQTGGAGFLKGRVV